MSLGGEGKDEQQLGLTKMRGNHHHPERPERKPEEKQEGEKTNRDHVREILQLN